jgi:hypothetical protein
MKIVSWLPELVLQPQKTNTYQSTSILNSVYIRYKSCQQQPDQMSQSTPVTWFLYNSYLMLLCPLQNNKLHGSKEGKVVS